MHDEALKKILEMIENKLGEAKVLQAKCEAAGVDDALQREFNELLELYPEWLPFGIKCSNGLFGGTEDIDVFYGFLKVAPESLARLIVRRIEINVKALINECNEILDERFKKQPDEKKEETKP